MLKATFANLIETYTTDQSLSSNYWDEIYRHYSNKKRHYHNLSHLENLLSQLSEIKDKIEDWNTILFTLFYHDLIYSALKSNNEEKSAELAGQIMQQLKISRNTIEKCKAQILATKTHVKSEQADSNYFIDADLSILGLDWEIYNLYSKNVRKEYAIYPLPIYISGRKKVLKHFLDMKRIYKTDYFYEKYELRAKENLNKELKLLG